MPRSTRPVRGALRRALRNLGVAARDVVAAPLAGRVPRDWVVVRLDRGLGEAAALPSWLEPFRPSPRPLHAVLGALHRVRADERVRGVLLRTGRAGLGWSKVSSLARAAAAVRAAGKRLVVYAESAGNAGAWLGAGADRFWMTPEGRLDLVGVRSDSPYLRDALELLRIRPDVLHAGRYKSAGEIIDRASMSEPAREALESTVDELYGALVDGLAARAGGADAARAWIDGGPYLAAEARELGLVDELVYADEIPARLEALAPAREGRVEAGGREPEARLLAEPTYLRVSRPRFQLEPLHRDRPALAVVPLTGVLRTGEGSARPVIRLLARVGENPRFRAAVLRVDSPGGDPLASDLIWRAVGKLRERKPVVASLGDTAASGGYYAAMAANEIVAEATTLTGSIGVVLAALEFDELLGALGVRFDGVGRGEHAAIYALYRRRSDEERALLLRQVGRIYRHFVEKAAGARGVRAEVVERVAEGRVWTGAQALERGLVDHLGGLEVALERARALAGLAPGEGDPHHLPPQVPLLERLRPRDPVNTALESLQRPQLLCPIRVPLG